MQCNSDSVGKSSELPQRGEEQIDSWGEDVGFPLPEVFEGRLHKHLSRRAIGELILPCGDIMDYVTFSGPFPPSEAAGRGGGGGKKSFLAIWRDVCVYIQLYLPGYRQHCHRRCSVG